MARRRRGKLRNVRAHGSYPPIGSYAFISDCHSAALVGADGSVDWCCMPRFDSSPTFARLLDWDRGGFCRIRPRGRHTTTRRYVDDTLVLETRHRANGGEITVTDCFTMRAGGGRAPHRQLLRVIEGVRGTVAVDIDVVIRFDYAEVKPWLRHHGPGLWSAIGGNDAMVVASDAELDVVALHDLRARVEIHAGERVRLSLSYLDPERIDPAPPTPASADELDERMQSTIAWWRRWSGKLRIDGPLAPAVRRSALVLKGLIHAPTGAVVAAPTTSLPEAIGAERNWDYRFSWIRDSHFTVRSLAELGAVAEADGFRRFVERSAAGSVESLQIMYGVGGERRLTELTVDSLEGYRASAPVRVGNAASRQTQLDVFGELLDLSWRWHDRGSSPDDDYWRFLVSVVDFVAEHWEEPDRGLWEFRGPPQHFVFSKAMCWVALERGLELARDSMRRAPTRRWRAARDALRTALDEQGFDATRGSFVQSFGSKSLDASVLLLPAFGVVDWNDPRMISTVDAVRAELDDSGLLRRYTGDDALGGTEGTFLACSFWLAECLAHQGRLDDARAVFKRAAATANPLGLFSEEYDTRAGQMLGNFPQALTHLSHITAAVAITHTSTGR